jgi:hypothetical protein
MAEETPSNVVTHDRFMKHTTSERVAELKAAGVIPDVTRTLADLKLSELQMGEAVIGELTADETDLYIAYADAKTEVLRLDRELMADQLYQAGDAFKRGEEDKFALGSGLDADQMREYFKLMRRADLLGASFFWTIGERLNIHDHMLGVRTKGRIVKGKRKWGQAE